MTFNPSVNLINIFNSVIQGELLFHSLNYFYSSFFQSSKVQENGFQGVDRSPNLNYLQHINYTKRGVSF